MNSFLNFIYKMLEYRRNFRLSKDKSYLTEKLISDYNNIKLKES